MSDTMRMTGLYSGMDTESIIQALVSAKSEKVTTLQNEQKKLEWTQNVWQDLNSQIYSLYSKTLSNMRLSSNYAKKTTKISDSTKASIVASSTAVNGTQTLQINKTAKAGYLTGASLANKIETKTSKFTTSSKLSDIDSSLAGKTITLSVDDGQGNQNSVNLTIDENTKISDVVSAINNNKDITGVSAEYDEDNSIFVLTANDSSTQIQFTEDSEGALKALGLDGYTSYQSGNVTGAGDYSFNGKDIGVKTEKVTTKNQSFTTSNLLADIDSTLSGKRVNIKVGTGDDATTTSIDITSDMTIASFVNKLQEAGVNASFDENNQRFFISSTSTGTESEFSLSSTSAAVLKSLGLYTGSTDDNGDGVIITDADKYDSQATRVIAQDAEIVLNGATFTSSSNTFSINGLTITANDVTNGDTLTITTDTDYDGIYDMIKDFLSEYNEVINKMYKLYNAESARKYDMLTDEEKESMTDDEIESWEDKIKSALLRNDSTLYSVMNTMRNATTSYYTVNGKNLYLSNFGIGTLSYFVADEDERYALHIDGDSDDENTSANTDKLMAALASDPEGTIEFFSSLCKNMYDSLYKAMGSTDYSSIYKVYDDKRLKDEYEDYDDKISDAEDELSDYEDYWYDKFGSMETALSKLQSTQNTITSLLGS